MSDKNYTTTATRTLTHKCSRLLISQQLVYIMIHHVLGMTMSLTI